MTVNYTPLQSKSGFTSPGFTVNSSGDLVASNIATESHFAINSTTVLTSDTLGSSITHSSLTSVGTLTGLTVNSTGAIVLDSGATGSIDNIDIGSVTPGTGAFTSLTTDSLTSNDLFIGQLNVKSLAVAMSIALQ